MPDVSICIPTRNRARKLHETLEHLASFNRVDFEVVVSDNASEDDTPSVLDHFQDRLPSLHRLRQETPLSFFGTLQPPFNVAVGDILVYLADDDRILEDGLEKVVHRMKADSSLSVIYAGWQETSEDFRQRSTQHQMPEYEHRFKGQDVSVVYETMDAVEMPVMRREAYHRSLAPINFQYPFDLYGLTELLKCGDALLFPVLLHLVARHDGQESRALYRDEIMSCYMADYELAAAACSKWNQFQAAQSIGRKISHQYVVAAQRALDDLQFLKARTLIKRSLAYRNEHAQAWALALDEKLWPALVAEAAVAFARTAPPVRSIVIEEDETTAQIVDHLLVLGDGLEILVGKRDVLVQAPYQDDEFFLYVDEETRQAREQCCGQRIRKCRRVEQIRTACRIREPEQGDMLWPAASM